MGGRTFVLQVKGGDFVKFKRGDVVRIIGNTHDTHYAVVPSVGVVVRVYSRDDYEVECTSRTHGGKTRQLIYGKDLASKTAIL